MSFELQGVRYCYPERTTPALDGVTALLPAGRTTAVLGQNGTGKSTLLYLLGLLWDGPLADGSIRYCAPDGSVIDYTDLAPDQRAELRLREFGFILQKCDLLPHFTCRQNVAMPLLLQGVLEHTWQPRVEALLNEADDPAAPEPLGANADRLGNRVSGGQRQRFAVLRAIAHNPRVLFADEPTASSDQVRAIRLVENLLREWKEGRLGASGAGTAHTIGTGRTLILVTHDFRSAARLADHFFLLNRKHQMIHSRLYDREDFPQDENDAERELKLLLERHD